MAVFFRIRLGMLSIFFSVGVYHNDELFPEYYYTFPYYYNYYNYYNYYYYYYSPWVRLEILLYMGETPMLNPQVAFGNCYMTLRSSVKIVEGRLG